MNEALAPEVDEKEIDCSEAALESMREEIAALEEKETVLTEKLAKARTAGLIYQSARCRALLQKIVMLKRAKKEELKIAEAHALAAELDSFANEMENELDPEFVKQDEEAQAQISAYRMKAKKGKLAAKILTAIALFACLTGAIVYLLLSLPEIMNIPFNWVYLAADAAILVVMLVIAACCNSSAKANDALADAVEAERQQAIDEYNEQLRVEMMSLASLEAVAEAYDIEGLTSESCECTCKKSIGARYADMLASVRAKIPEEKLEKFDKAAAKAKKHAKIIGVAAGACIALVAFHKIKAETSKAKNRRKFFTWLG